MNDNFFHLPIVYVDILSKKQHSLPSDLTALSNNLSKCINISTGGIYVFHLGQNDLYINLFTCILLYIYFQMIVHDYLHG